MTDYDLDETLSSGQVFRWTKADEDWTGVVGRRWVCLRQRGDLIHARTATPQTDWSWLEDYLQLRVKLDAVLAAFPPDPYLGEAVGACRGLRLLRQDPWECLASFILSSSKQIVQIRQIVETLSSRFGLSLPVPAGNAAAFAFPSASQLAAVTETGLRDCKMGFRAPYLLAIARLVCAGICDLDRLRRLSLDQARSELLRLPGVGEKIADCVLLFAYGFPTAFPVDVWVMRALRKFYFRGRRIRPARLRGFIPAYFGPQAGYAQQYLFHYVRTRHPKRLLSR